MILRPTLAGPHRFEVEIKKSRFIAQAAPADSIGFQSQLRDSTRGQVRISLPDESAKHLANRDAAPTSER